MSQRAIVYFQEQSCKKSTSTEALHYYDRAIKALRKQDQMQVNHEKTFWTYKHYCPACSELLRVEGLNYCPYCGQKLDWSNYWEALI